jgi:sugar phosphate permease
VYVHPIFSVLIRGVLGLGFVSLCINKKMYSYFQQYIHFQGIGITSSNAIIAKWYPASEKGTIVAIVSCGNQLGPVLAYPLGSILCPYRDILGGWPLLFYVSGR